MNADMTMGDPERAHGSRPPRLHLGCGDRAHPDWLNADLRAGSGLELDGVVELDVRAPLPFADASFDAVYHAHLLEHLTPDEGRAMVGECVRVLRPGGVLRVTIPDLEGLVRSYLAQLEAATRGEPGSADRYDWAVIELLDQIVRTTPGGRMLRWWAEEPVRARDLVEARMGEQFAKTRAVIESHRSATGAAPAWAASAPDAAGAEAETAFRRTGEAHKWMYDRFSLVRLLEEAGLESVATVGPGDSRIDGWAGFRLELDEAGRARKPDSLAAEGVKPGG